MTSIENDWLLIIFCNVELLKFFISFLIVDIQNPFFIFLLQRTDYYN